MTSSSHDTIVALATPFGISALAVIRFSGPEAIAITDRLFSSSKINNLREAKSHTVHYGRINEGSKSIDEVMVSVFKSPHTYTAQDIVEVSCHGGGVIISTLLDLFSRQGARPAEPGEFTKRAFLNGKMDLSQAESVNSLINAGSRRALDEVLKILKGSLREKIEEIKSALFNVKANIDADIEWGETEELEVIDRSDIIDILTSALSKIEEILDNSKAYAGIYSGFRVVIIGRPNAGKSSLFNRLLEESRSIVNNIPGTTRDVIESEVVSGSYLIRYVDTAGLGLKDPSEIDILSAEKSREEIKVADTVVILIDKEMGISKPERDIVKLSEKKKKIVVLNKSDLKDGIPERDISEISSKDSIIPVSCKTGAGLERLKKEIEGQIDKASPGHIMVSARQRNSFKETAGSIKKVIDIMKTTPVSYEIASYEIFEAINYLGLIDGSVIKEDILDRIFSDFCIGK